MRYEEALSKGNAETSCDSGVAYTELISLIKNESLTTGRCTRSCSFEKNEERWVNTSDM